MSSGCFNPYPTQIVQGDSFSFSANGSQYSPADYTSLIAFQGYDTQQVAGIVDPDNASLFKYTFTSAFTLAFTPGTNLYTVFYFDTDGNRTRGQSFQLIVVPDPLTLQPPTPEQTILTNIQSAIEALALGQNTKISVNGQDYEKKDLASLMEVERYYASRVAQQKQRLEQAMGVARPQVISQRFKADGYCNPWVISPRTSNG